MNFLPSADFRRATRRGDVGTEVGVLQLNLPGLVVDGNFGKLTEGAVKDWQRAHNLVVDGIAGLVTQQSIVSAQLKVPTTKYRLPGGLLKSIAENESGFALAAAGRHIPPPGVIDNGWDIGAFCRSSGELAPTQDFLRSAYSVVESADWTGAKVAAERKNYAPIKSRYLTELANGDVEQFRWQLAILAHNWPVGARNISDRGFATMSYVGDANDDDKPAAWVENATRDSQGNARLHTPREWCMSYVQRATVYCKW